MLNNILIFEITFQFKIFTFYTKIFFWCLYLHILGGKWVLVR